MSEETGRPAGLRSTSVPIEPVVEPVPVSDASLDAQLLEVFFDRAPMGVAVFGTDQRLQRCNKTWTGFYEHYFGVDAAYTKPGRHIFELLPGNEESVQPLFDNALAGRMVRQAAHRISIPGLDTYWDVVFAPLFRDGEVVGVVDIVTDATDRVKAFQRLEARIAAFTSLAAGMTVDQPLEVTLREVVAAVLRTTEAVACSVLCWAEEPVGAPVAYVSESFAPGYAEALAASWTTDTGDPVLEPPRLTVRRGFREEALTQPRFDRLHPYWTEPTWGDIAAVPVSASGRSFGELHLYLPAGTQLDGDDETYLLALADQAAVAAQNAALFGTAAQNATLLERQRLSRDLHDSVSQALFSMTLHARAAERHLEAAGAGSSAAAGEVARLRELTAGALAEMRALIFELRPGALAEEGLAAALTKQAAAIAARAAVPVDVTTPEVRVPLDPDVEEHLYRLAMEALNNALRHADASRLSLTLRAADGALTVEVRDDGTGFDLGQPHPGHLGLHTMHERAAAAGAELSIVSAPGTGTTVSATVPVP